MGMNGTGIVVEERAVSMQDDYTATERAALIATYLMQGEAMTTAEVADKTGLSHSGAWRLMARMGRVVAVCQDDGGRWQLFENR